MLYEPNAVSLVEREQILRWLQTIHPIWEWRYSQVDGPPAGESQRKLLRPVYWLGNWQFACLDYYRPPNGILNRAIRAEAFPAVLSGIVRRAEELALRTYQGAELPRGWKLNTCLVNFYGRRLLPDEKWEDVARVGEHKDYEPGPVASVSLGERALFQFVESSQKGTRKGVVLQQWLEDRSLQIFGGERWKRKLFHRVQRVEEKRPAEQLGPEIDGFRTRRINFTFRYVPEAHWADYEGLPPQIQESIREYVEVLAQNSDFFRSALLGSKAHEG